MFSETQMQNHFAENLALGLVPSWQHSIIFSEGRLGWEGNNNQGSARNVVNQLLLPWIHDMMKAQKNEKRLENEWNAGMECEECQGGFAALMVGSPMSSIASLFRRRTIVMCALNRFTWSPRWQSLAHLPTPASGPCNNWNNSDGPRPSWKKLESETSYPAAKVQQWCAASYVPVGSFAPTPKRKLKK